MSTLLIEGATVITVDDNNNIFAPGDVASSNGRLTYVGPARQNRPEKYDAVFSGQGKIVLPGLVNTHTHAAMTLFRSYADDLALHAWLNEIIWPLEAKLTPKAVYWGSLLACLEMMEAGVTTFADMYFYMEETAAAANESGLRADLSVGMTGLNPVTGKKALRQAVNFVQQYNNSAGGRITCRLGPHAPYTCPQPFLLEVGKAARELNCGIHIHLAETKQEVEELKQKTGLTPIEFYHHMLEQVGPIPTIAAHCVHVNKTDVELLAKNKIGVAHNPGSNLKLASGIAPLTMLMAENIAVGLGTDGAASNNNLDLLEEARLAALIHKCTNDDPTVVSAQEALRLATIGGAQVLGLQEEIGSLEIGKQADLIVLNEGSPHLYPRHNVVSRLIYSARAADIELVAVGGKILVEQGRAVALNRARIMSEVQKIVEEIW